MSSQHLYAALIGINAYEKANSLDGCIKDVLNLDRILRNLCLQQEPGKLVYKPFYLLSPHPGDKEIIDDYKKDNADFDPLLPSFANVSGKVFEHLGQASGNDICLLYYSGHGSFIDAPPEFSRSKATAQNETLVCMDSRSAARDLIDKELAFLLHKTLKDKPDVHCLVIMDCCHGGNNTREIVSTAAPAKYRQESPSNQKRSLQDYIGFNEGFFTIKNGEASFPVANYVHFAACRDNEKALDGYAGGLFTRKFVELLGQGGNASSYKNIMQSLVSTVSLQNGQQNPVCFSAKPSNLDLQFLGRKMLPYQPSYEVRYLSKSKTWQLQAGSLQGIVPSGGGQKTLVTVQPGNIEAEVTASADFSSTLQGDRLSTLDTSKNIYKAVIAELAIKRQVIGISEELKKLPVQLEKLIAATGNNKMLYAQLDAEGKNKADYLVGVLKKGSDYSYYLSQTNNDTPLFKSETDVDSFLNNIDAIGKWVYVKNLQTSKSIFREDDFVFTAEIIEGETITQENVSSLKGTPQVIQPGTQLTLSYKNDQRPVLKFSVQINPASKHKDCYVEALYLSSLFGVHTNFSEDDTNHLTKAGKFELKTNSGGTYYNFIRLELDEDYAAYNINEITEQLKIIVSAKPNIALAQYRQPSLKLDPTDLNFKSKSITEELFDAKPGSEWGVFNFNIRIIGSKKEKTLVANQETDFSSFSVQSPAGFNAIATVVTNGDMATATRSISDIAPPIWGDAISDSTPFGDAFGAMTDSAVVALELGAKEGEPMPVLEDGKELVIKVKENVTRSIENYDSTTIPYGYDEATGFYFPLGYQDKQGDIHITQLPPQSNGSLIAPALTTRSIGGSIKLYFKKLFRLPTNVLTLHAYDDGKWKKMTGTVEIKNHLSSLKPQKLPLVIHGIFGDTKSIVEGLKGDNDFAKKFPAILSYDYENLNSKVPETAEKLKSALQAIGIGENGIPKLTVIAHSMGGLVSRWLIEIGGGAPLVEKLIMAGTPNGGSEWSKGGQDILKGAKFLLTHALNITGPVKYAISGISFLIKKFHDPLASLKDMGLDGQPIKELNESSQPANIPYYLIASDTSLLREYEGDDGFLAKLKRNIMNKVAFPCFDLALFEQKPNDMAVTLNSMKTINGFDNVTKMKTLPGDHISYFTQSITRKAILEQAAN
jgi:pimeloyl-ACP methyl ester carboxylesterase